MGCEIGTGSERSQLLKAGKETEGHAKQVNT